MERNNYYTKEQVKELLKKNNKSFDDFIKWHFGQTVPLVDGEIAYYKWDVERYLGGKRL